MACFKNPLSLNAAIKKRPVAEILTLGTELVSGSVLNTNAQYLGKELSELGFCVENQTACQDDRFSIQEALRVALRRSEVILLSGGLGPTPDDITRQTIAHFFHVPLLLSQAQYHAICRYYRKRGKKIPKSVRQEALFPANAKPVFNRFGIALGFTIGEQGKTLIVLPGVPNELTQLFKTHIRPYLQKKFLGLRPPFSLIMKTVGLSEPVIMERLGGSFFRQGDFQFGIYPETGEVAIRIYAGRRLLIRKLKRHAVRVMKKEIYSFIEEPLEKAIGKLLRAGRWRISVAESCTGGQIAERISRVPGASRYFSGGVVAYENRIKEEMLGVPKTMLESGGAVSEQTALAMARGVRDRFGTSLGVAVTGIAGPSGDTSKKPVGLVFVAIVSKDRQKVWKELFIGNREQIQNRASKKALEHLWRWFQN